MANGRSGHEHVESVKSTVDCLECSPSHHSVTSPIAYGGSRAVGHGVSEKTGKFASHGKTTRPKPRGTKTGFGKKSHSFQKSTGR